MDKGYTLVTGAAGFIGSALVKKILLENGRVIAVDCFLPDLYSAEVKRLRWKLLGNNSDENLLKFEFDLRKDDFSIFNDYEISSIINQAAMPGLNRDWSKFERYYECNLHALHRILEYSKTLNLDSFIQASTSSVYGKFAVGNEEQDLAPTSPYGVSKLAAEKLLLSYLEWFGIPAKILRYFSVYGPNQRPDMAYAKIIEATLKSTPFEVYGDGEQIRSNTYIDDVVEATLKANESTCVGSIFNICGDEGITLNAAISEIENLIGQEMVRKTSQVRIGDQQDTRGSSERARKMLGWEPKTPFYKGIKAQVDAKLKQSLSN